MSNGIECPYHEILYHRMDIPARRKECFNTMAEKRKDSKGRVLKEGEFQRKNGKYEYKYTQNGERKTVYSWRLLATDKNPEGKKYDLSLREKEKEISRDLDDGINTTLAHQINLNEMFEMYLRSKKKLSSKTKAKYRQLWKLHVAESPLGLMTPGKMKKANIQHFYAGLSDEGMSDTTIRMYHNNLIQPTLVYAVDNDLLRKNPAKGCLDGYTDCKKRNALTREEQRIFLDFVKNSKYYNVYLPMLQIMIGTACRIGEISGLTWDDVDMKKREIHINHQLVYEKVDGKATLYIDTPKSESGNRTIGMTSQVRNAFLEQKALCIRLGRRSVVEVDGYKDFIFLNNWNRPYTTTGFNAVLGRIVTHYNKEEQKKAEKEKRKPLLLPHISNHILRHTGCTRMAEAGMDIKVLQTIMGHSDPAITLKVYDHVDNERMKNEVLKVEYVV